MTKIHCNGKYTHHVGHAIMSGAVIVLLFFLQSQYNCTGAMETARIQECVDIKSDTVRLDCFDKLTGRKPAVTEKTPLQLEHTEKEQETPQGQPSQPSVLSKDWDLDKKERHFAIRSYRPSYILPIAYNFTPNRDYILDRDSNSKAMHTEAKFQISFKVKLLQDIMDKDVDLWFAYTQLSFWQLYNKAFSSPFRESNYEPELLLNFRTNYDLLGLKGRIINVGLNHQSNGRSEPLSRSWNRIVANLGFEKDNFDFLLKTWYRIPERADNDDNPNIEKYLGYGELWGFYNWGGHRFGLMVRNNLRAWDNKGATQLDWSFPVPFIENKHLHYYIQYFNGYGESLVDYNKSVNRISVGFMLKDW